MKEIIKIDQIKKTLGFENMTWKDSLDYGENIFVVTTSLPFEQGTGEIVRAFHDYFSSLNFIRQEKLKDKADTKFERQFFIDVFHFYTGEYLFHIDWEKIKKEINKHEQQ